MVTSNASVNVGCGICRKASKLLSKTFKHKPNNNRTLSTPRRAQKHSYSSTTSSQTTDNSPYFSDSTDSEKLNIKAVQDFRKLGSQSVAVEKDSDDPYLDFRQSMLEMIQENEIYCKNDLGELLSCFLELNEPHLHGIIVRAFTEIWNAIYLGRVVPSNYMHGVQRSREI